MKIIRISDGTVRLLIDRPRVFSQPCGVPGMEDAGRDRWKVRMTDRKHGTKFKGITDHAKSRLQQTNRSGFARVQVLSAHFPQCDVSAEISFVKRHKVWMNVPFMSIRFRVMGPMKDAAC